MLYVTRTQKERFASPEAYEAVKGSYRVDQRLLSRAKPTMVLLHPLPRNDELADDVSSAVRRSKRRSGEVLTHGCTGHVRRPLRRVPAGQGGPVRAPRPARHGARIKGEAAHSLSRLRL